MSDENTKTPLELRRKQIGLWAAGIFSALSVAFIGYSNYIVWINQKGRFDLSDKLLMPVTYLMFLFSISSYLLIRRNRVVLGSWLLFFMVNLLPPVLAILILTNIVSVAILYVVVLSIFIIGWVFPARSKRWGIAVAGVTILLIVGIELWNPGFRTGNSLSTYSAVVTILAGLGLAVFFVRQAWLGNITTKLIAAFVVISIISVGIITLAAQQSLSASLTSNIRNNLADLADARSNEIALAVDRELFALKTLAQSQDVENAARIATEATPMALTEIDRLDQQWREADKADNDADPLVVGVLTNEIADQLRKYREQFPQQVEVFLTDLQGVSIATTNRTSDYLQSDEEWWQTAYRDGLFIGQPEYDDSSKTIAMNMAVTVRENGTGKVVGVLRTTVNFVTLADTLSAGLFGKTGRTNIYLPAGQELKLNTNEGDSVELVAEQALPELQAMAQTAQKSSQLSLNGVPTLAGKANVSIPGDTGLDAVAIGGLNWQVITLQDRADALQPVNTQTRNILIITGAILLVVALVAFSLARVISGPIVRLTAYARQVASGDLAVEARVETRDEIGALAVTFNTMVTQLRQTLTGLEQRVADRTRAIETSTEVSRRLSTILDQQELVSQVVQQVQSAFNYYHAHIYLYDERQESLVMAGGTGEVGQTLLARGHRISRGRGLVGRAAENNMAVLVSDTQQDPTWLPNPLLPDTRSEAAVPIAVGDTVLGVLDVQHNVVNGLTQVDVDLLQSISSQVAIALQNARSYAEAQRRAEREALLGSIGQKIRQATSVDEALQVTARELGRVVGAPYTRVRLGLSVKTNPQGE